MRMIALWETGGIHVTKTERQGKAPAIHVTVPECNPPHNGRVTCIAGLHSGRVSCIVGVTCIAVTLSLSQIQPPPSNIPWTRVFHSIQRCILYCYHYQDWMCTLFNYIDSQNRRHQADFSVGWLTHCNTLQHTATHCNTLQQLQQAPPSKWICGVADTLQHTATHCNTLQHTVITATRCNRRHEASYSVAWLCRHAGVCLVSFICVPWRVHVCDRLISTCGMSW